MKDEVQLQVPGSERRCGTEPADGCGAGKDLGGEQITDTVQLGEGGAGRGDRDGDLVTAAAIRWSSRRTSATSLTARARRVRPCVARGRTRRKAVAAASAVSLRGSSQGRAW